MGSSDDAEPKTIQYQQISAGIQPGANCHMSLHSHSREFHKHSLVFIFHLHFSSSPSLLQTIPTLYGPNGPYSFFCTPLDYSENEISVTVLKYNWFFFLVKFFDLFDTVRIFLGNNNPISSVLFLTRTVSILGVLRS